MNEWPIPTTTLVAVAPALAAMFASPSLSRRVARQLGVGTALGMLLLTLAVSFAWHLLGGLPASDVFDPGRWMGRAPLFVVDELNSLMLPFTAAIFAFVLLVQPGTLAIEHTLRRVLLAEAVTLATFLSSDPLVLAGLWCLSAAGGWFELHLQGNDGRRAGRVFAVYTMVSCMLLLLGVTVLQIDSPVAGGTASLLIALAVMVRKGIVPLHSWMPELFAHAPLPVSVLFNAPQIGAWVAVRLVAPHAPVWVLESVSLASLATAVYGAGVALVQVEARRVFAWLFLSQSALILVGLESHASVAQAGGLSLWISSGLALSGFGMTIAALEARRGALSLRQFAGGYERKPLLAACFLVLGLASVGFPGTLGFVGQEALVHGVVSDFPYLGFAILLVSMLNGIAVLRTYFVLFCGRQEPGRLSQTLRPREQVGFVTLATLLVVSGLFPGPFARSRSRAVEGIRPAAANEPSNADGARTRSKKHPRPLWVDATAQCR
jgi:NADH-quinone oxidoreductase subunit M